MENDNRIMDIELKKEKSCGCIIIENDKVLLTYEKKSQYWGFPKGHIENNENEMSTAMREVKEEVGLEVEIHKEKRYVLNYVIDNEIDKTTVLYLATPKNKELVMRESEIEKVRWCNFTEALDLLTYNNLKEILKRVLKDIRN